METSNISFSAFDDNDNFGFDNDFFSCDTGKPLGGSSAGADVPTPFSAFDFSDCTAAPPRNDDTAARLWTDSFANTGSDALWLGAPGGCDIPVSSPLTAAEPRLRRTHTAPVTLKKGSARQDYFEVGQNSLEVYMPEATAEDREFIALCKNKSFLINPHQIGFIPQNYFLNQYYAFGDVVVHYFHKKNNSNARFPHKLYNAICLGIAFPEYMKFIGVAWLSRSVIHVSKNRFARLLGIKTVDGSLFHRQGNFPSCGFVELSCAEIIAQFGEAKLNSMDCDVDKLVRHSQGIFVRDGDVQKILEMCRWKSCKLRN